MRFRTILMAVAIAVIVLPWTAYADVPRIIEVTVDVDRRFFQEAKGESIVTFRLYDAQTLGNLCYSQTLPMSELTVRRVNTMSFDGQRPLTFTKVSTMLGSDAAPVVLCAGPQTWVELGVGDVRFPRERLVSVPFTLRPASEGLIFGGWFCSGTISASGSNNPLTGQQSCPDGFTAALMFASGGLGNCSGQCVIFNCTMCYKNP